MDNQKFKNVNINGMKSLSISDGFERKENTAWNKKNVTLN